jgi:hypothetical protein
MMICEILSAKGLALRNERRARFDHTELCDRLGLN